MATIQSSIQLMDGMSKPLNSIISSINMTISALQRVNGTTVNLNTSELLGAQAEIQRAGAQIRSIENNIANSIDAQVNAQNKLNNSMNSGITAASNLYSKIGKMVGAYAGIRTLMSGLNLSDTITQNTARLNLMNDGNQSTTELQNMIFKSAQSSRGNYFSTLDSIGKMGLTAGDAFNSNAELIGFMELINKQFKISGTSAPGIDAAMLQLTQAMGAGVLRGEELNSIFEQAPLIVKNIANYMGVPIGQIKTLAAEGKLTSDIVKNAMFYAANDINKKFGSIPTTFNDMIVNLKNNFMRAYEPISVRLSNLFNSSNFKTFTGMLITGMTRVINLTVSGMDIISKFATVMKNNWDVISPALGAVTFGVLAYKSSLIMANAELIKNNILQGKNIIGSITMAGKNLYLAASTFLGTVAQEGFNAVLYACPITWIVGGIMLLIGALYAGVAAFNAITGKSVSATGIITGGIGMIVATVINMGATIWNTLLSVAEFMMNVFTHPIYAIKKMIGDFILDFIDNLKFLAGVSDKVLGTEFTASLNDAETWVNTKLTQAKPENYADISDLRAKSVNPFEMGKDFYNYGSNLFSFGSGLENPEMAKMNEYLSEINKNTSNMVDGLDASTEEIKYMRDIAEMEVINRFTTAEVKVEVGGITNQVNSDLDLDTVVTKITDKMYEGISIAAEGVYD